MTDKFYDAENFWKKRFASVGLNIRGPGNWSLSTEENEKMYSEAANVFLGLCDQENVDLKKSRVLEIGTGNGFYANLLHEIRVKDYVGIDITDVLFDEIKDALPEANLHLMKLDIAESLPPGKFDLVIMIDVTQHIVDDDAFSNGMQNIRRCLVPGGFLFITSLLEDLGQITFHQRYRAMNSFEKEFKNDKIGTPIVFRDKFIFPIKMGNDHDYNSKD